MTSAAVPPPLSKIAAVYREFPLRLITPLRHIVASPTAKEAFANYCALFDTLTSYLGDLANSVYAAQPIDSVDERLEHKLRTIEPPLSLGTKVMGLGAFAGSQVDFGGAVPELRELFAEKRLPVACTRLVSDFALIREARELGIPPTHIERYIQKHALNDDSLRRCNLNNFLLAITPFRNKGHGHLDDDSWFPNDPQMFAIVRGYLESAVDDLLTWSPLQALLINYEVVRVEAHVAGAARTCPIARFDIADGVVPWPPRSCASPPTSSPKKAS
jgi:hypothetical protein